MDGKSAMCLVLRSLFTSESAVCLHLSQLFVYFFAWHHTGAKTNILSRKLLEITRNQMFENVNFVKNEALKL